MQRTLSAYSSRAEKRFSPFASRRTADFPTWFLIPAWLGIRYAHHACVTPAFVADVTWAQYCLFYSVRLKDDLLDGQAKDPALLFTADVFLCEAENTFLNHFPRPAGFWDFHGDALSRTGLAILRVRALQRKKTISLTHLKNLYHDVNALFKIGSAAFMHRTGNHRDFPAISRFLDDVSFTGQVMDDLQDMEEDLREEKRNYALRYLAGDRRDSAGVEKILERVHRQILLSGRLSRLLRRLRTDLEGTAEAIRPLRMRPAEEHLRGMCENLQACEERHHLQRVGLIFGAL